MNEKNIRGWAFIIAVSLVIFIILFMILKPNKGPQKPITTTIEIHDTVEQNTTENTVGGSAFSDGLENPESVKRFEPDEFGAGVVEISEYNIDINNDGKPDRITRTRENSESAHFTYIYKVELNVNGELVDITPKGFQTIEGLECALQKLKFSFNPDFSVTVISRPLGQTWDTPTTSTRIVYTLWGNRMYAASKKTGKTICDVSELFEER